MGELNELMDDGTYESLMDHVSSINVACGGHAGDNVMMNTMVKLAKDKKVNIGAHPSYPDKENFGRYEIDISISALKDSISILIFSSFLLFFMIIHDITIIKIWYRFF